jgi:hypothetical protein
VSVVTIRVHEAGAVDRPVAEAAVQVFQGFAEDPAQFLGPWPPLRFVGRTAEDGSVEVDMRTGAENPTPHLVVVEPPAGWNDRAGGAASSLVVGHPGGEVTGPEGDVITELAIALTRAQPVAPSKPQVPPPRVPAPLGPVAQPIAEPREHSDAPDLLDYQSARRGLLLPVGSIVLVLGSVVVALLVGHNNAAPSRRAPNVAHPVAAGAFALPPGPLDGTAVFANGQGNCPGLPPAFNRPVVLTQTGSDLRLVSPMALDTVVGTIESDGRFEVRNSAEEYVAIFHGSTATGFYRATDPRTKCTETYTVRFSPSAH